MTRDQIARMLELWEPSPVLDAAFALQGAQVTDERSDQDLLEAANAAGFGLDDDDAEALRDMLDSADTIVGADSVALAEQPFESFEMQFWRDRNGAVWATVRAGTEIFAPVRLEDDDLQFAWDYQRCIAAVNAPPPVFVDSGDE